MKKMISVRIDQELLAKAKIKAEMEKKTLTELIEEGLKNVITKAN